MSAFEGLLTAPASRTVAWVLLHFLWQGALVATALAGALALLRRARDRYAASVAALALMFLLPFATAAVIAPGGSGGAGNGIASFPAVVPDAAPLSVGDGAVSFSPDARFGMGSLERFFPLLLGFWFLGVVFLSLRNLGGLLQIRRMTGCAVSDPPAEWSDRVRGLAVRIGVSRPVRFVRSGRIGVPTVVGWLRPVLLVPAAAFTGLDRRQLEAILAHELAHVRRHDYLVNLLQSLVETLLFYHPAVWWVSGKIRQEREHCADDIAVEVCGDARAYAGALARMEEIRTALPAPALAASGGSLVTRVGRLLGMPVRSRNHGWMPRVLASAAALTVALVGVGAELTDHDSFAALSPDADGLLRSDPVLATAPGAVFGGTLAEVPAIVGAPDASATGLVPPPAPAASPAPPAPEAPAAPAASPAPPAPEAPAAPAASPAPPAPEAPAAPGFSGVLAQHFPGADDRDPGDGLGTWEARRDGDWVVLQLRHTSRDGRGRYTQGLRIPAGRLRDLFDREDIDVELRREAGSFVFTGNALRTGSRWEADGTWDFEPDHDYLGRMAELGYRRIRPEEHLSLAVHDVTTGMVEEIQRAGYEDLRLERLIEFAIHGVTPDYIRGMAAAGYPDLPAERLVEFRIHGVTPEYVRGLRAAGYPDLPPQRVVEFKIHGVTPGYVRSMREAGFPDLSAQRLVEFKIHDLTPQYVEDLASIGIEGASPERILEFKIHDVTPEYARSLARVGLGDLGAKRLVEFKIHGITPEYVQEIHSLGIEGMSANRIVEFAIHGVTPGFAREMEQVGLGGLGANRLVEFRIHDVTPEYVREMKSLGIEGMSANRIVEFKIHGITAAYVRDLQDLGLRPGANRLVELKIHDVDAGFIRDVQELGYSGLTPEKAVELKIHDVTPDLISRLHDAGYDDLTLDEIVELKIHGMEETLLRRSRNR